MILPTTCPKQCRRKIGCSGWAGWASTWPIRRSQPATIAAYAEQQPLAAVLPVDDSGVVAAAAVAARLGLAYNAPAAAEAAAIST